MQERCVLLDSYWTGLGFLDRLDRPGQVILLYAPYDAELRQGGVRYQPMVWSSWGRAHLETQDTLQSLARAAARRRGLPDWRPLLQRARAAISVELQRRLVAQLRRCLPQDQDDESSPEAESPPRTRVPEDEELAAQGLDDAGDVGGPVRAARGPDFFAALRAVYGEGPPR